MNKQKDRVLAMHTIAALFRYRISRAWDAFLIALVSVRETVFARSRTPEPMRGTRLGLIAVLATVIGWVVQRSGQGEVLRP
ncbi:hypothetical protein [Streptomyces sp. NPDC096032]|uniref:hypothetical protein n=1 Tax=Streptomyces sp. NPDC096032 TaxID=3366070 RepID=UPI003827A8C5